MTVVKTDMSGAVISGTSWHRDGSGACLDNRGGRINIMRLSFMLVVFFLPLQLAGCGEDDSDTSDGGTIANGEPCDRCGVEQLKLSIILL